MIKDVFADIKVFLFYFLIVISFITLTAFILSTAEVTEFFEFFMLSIKLAIGETTIDDMFDEEEVFIRYTAGLILLAAALFLTIIMVALLVAVVSKSYERWIEMRQAQTFRQRTQLICERESIMTPEELEDEKYFPTHILVRRPRIVNPDLF